MSDEKDILIDDIRYIVSEIENEDETIDLLYGAMEYFCGTYDKCEGYKHAILETLDDQVRNHYDELSTQELLELKNKLTNN